MDIIVEINKREEELKNELEKISLVKEYLLSLFSDKVEDVVSERTLKFDIYERVIVQPPNMPVDEISGYDIYPNLNSNVKTDKDNIVGHLLLTVDYLSDGNGITKYRHTIPVSISVPNLVELYSNHKVSYSIENLKVEHIGKRALAVTGVLAIKY